ncbi:hypothetical protein, partial [Bacillus amyloliquefaciens]|uniref:hypothetical protein n=1 Tax=Bacillus amyloliquefaciens TaxID=1390 RepID=UPI001CA4CF84
AITVSAAAATAAKSAAKSISVHKKTSSFNYADPLSAGPASTINYVKAKKMYGHPPCFLNFLRQYSLTAP